MVLKRKLPTKNDAEASEKKNSAEVKPAAKPEVKEEAEQRPSRYADKAKEDAAAAHVEAPEPVVPQVSTPKEKPASLKRTMPKKADAPVKAEKPKNAPNAPQGSPEKPVVPPIGVQPIAPAKAPPPSDFEIPDIAPLGEPVEAEKPAPSHDMSSPEKESIMPWMDQKSSPMEPAKEEPKQEKPPIPDNVETPTSPMSSSEGGQSWLADDLTPPSLDVPAQAPKLDVPAEPFGAEPIAPPLTPPPGLGEPEKVEDSKSAGEKPFSFASAGQPPWKKAGEPKSDNPPVLPDAFQVAKDIGKKGFVGKIVTGLIAFVVIVFAVKMFNQRDKATEMLARWTGTLKQVSEEVPETTDDKTALVQPENIVQPGQSDEVESEVFDSLPDLEAFSDNNTQIEVLDVPLDEAGLPIVADTDDEMPEDLSLFANIQRAINEAQSEKNVEEAKEKGFDVEDESELSDEEIYLRNREMTLELQQQLTEYRKALASESDPLKKPKPSDFFETKKPARETSEMLAPPQETARFGANPYDLPVVPEPSSEEEVLNVRTLADFEATMYDKQEKRIRMPRGVRPKMENSDMVALEILSFVPNRGIIAFHQGREGVLLIGEAIEGWELVAVYEYYAEFSNGTRRQTVTMN
jgi:hypothetical protein